MASLICGISAGIEPAALTTASALEVLGKNHRYGMLWNRGQQQLQNEVRAGPVLQRNHKKLNFLLIPETNLPLESMLTKSHFLITHKLCHCCICIIFSYFRNETHLVMQYPLNSYFLTPSIDPPPDCYIPLQGHGGEGRVRPWPLDEA